MIVCIGGGDGERGASPPQPQSIRNAGVSLADVLVPRGSPSSTHEVIVMDALRGFSWEPLLWALDHVTGTGYTITLLGVMPWIPLPCKSFICFSYFSHSILISVLILFMPITTHYQAVNGQRLNSPPLNLSYNFF